MRRVTYIATGEITSLKHEVGDHTMELGAFVSEPFLASAKGAEVLGRFRGDVIVEDEVDSASLFCSPESLAHKLFDRILFFVCAGWQRERDRERTSLRGLIRWVSAKGKKG